MMNGQSNKKPFLMRNIYNFLDKLKIESALLDTAIKNFESVLDQIPKKDTVLLHWNRLIENSEPLIIKSLLSSRQFLYIILNLFALSDWIAQLIIAEPTIINWLIDKWKKGFISNKEDLKEELARYIIINKGRNLNNTLLFFKKRELIRIAALDFILHSDFNECLNQLSLLADVIIEAIYNEIFNNLIKKYGIPQYYDEHGNICNSTMTILALGKLGSNELNYHSDIDLLFLYSQDGETAGGENGKTTNKEFFTKLSQNIISLLSNEESNYEMIYRVDMDLRPYGKSGDLISSLPQALYYYKTWASLWEKVALLRCRYVAGDEALSDYFISKIQALLSSVKKDESIFKEIYELKKRINKELINDNSLESNLKLGKGGIREIEFIAHSLLLYHFKELYYLHSSNTLKLIHMLSSKGYITIEQEEILSEGYKILRKCEHYLQLSSGRQTHCLPTSEEKLKNMIALLSVNLDKLKELQISINSIFEKIFLQYLQRRLDDTVNIEELLFSPSLSAAKLLAALDYLGVNNKEFFLQDISNLVNRIKSFPLKYFSNTSLRKMLIDAFVYLAKEENSKNGLKNLDLFLYSIKEEPELLNFLIANKNLLETLCKIFCNNEIVSLFLRSNPNILLHINSPDSFFIEKKPIIETDIIEYTRLKKQITLMKISLMEAEKVYDRIQIQFLLSQFVRNLIKEVIDKLSEKEQKEFSNSLITFSLGRLSLNEFNYQSDIDLIWIYPSINNNDAALQQYYYSLLIQRFIKIFTLITSQGYLYKIDSRIRPSGREGELAVSSNYLLQYLQKEARIWELLSLHKLSYISGDDKLASELLNSIREFIFEKLAKVDLKKEILNLIERFAGEYPKEHIKYGQGGLMDINLFLQYHLIKNKIMISIERGTNILLKELKEKGIITKEDYEEIYYLWDTLENITHWIRMRNQEAIINKPIAEILESLRGINNTDLAVLNHYRDKMRKRLIDL